MKTRVDLAPQVEEFIRGRAPEPRRSLRSALRGLEAERGDIKALEGELNGFWRLRVGEYRVIYTIEVVAGERVVRCLFAERRALVYAMFTKAIQILLGRAG